LAARYVRSGWDGVPMTKNAPAQLHTARGATPRRLPEMQTKPTRRLAGAEQRSTHDDELEARRTLSRVQRAVEDGDSDDVAVAAAAWRQAARLADRLQRQAREIADDLEHS
jgi:hypothetical protein